MKNLEQANSIGMEVEQRLPGVGGRRDGLLNGHAFLLGTIRKCWVYIVVIII